MKAKGISVTGEAINYFDAFFFKLKHLSLSRSVALHDVHVCMYENVKRKKIEVFQYLHWIWKQIAQTKVVNDFKICLECKFA